MCFFFFFYHSTLTILVDIIVISVISCNILLRPALHENVTRMQEKVFFFPESLSGKVDMRGVSCSSHTEADHTEDTQRMECVCLCVCVGVMHKGGAQGNPHSPES